MTLAVVAGLTGAGKTTFARRLAAERGALRLCPDEWMAALGIDLFDEPFRARLESRLTDLAGQALAVGTAVVVEFGSWARDERDALLATARRAGARAEMYVLDPPAEVVWERLAARDTGPGGTVIGRAVWETYLPHWQVPDDVELARWDAASVLG